MYKITRDIILDVNDTSTQSTITIQQEIADTYRLAMHITGNGSPADLSDYLVQIKATKPDGTEVSGSCNVSGDTAYYVVESQFAAVAGYMNCRLEISESDEILYALKFRCIITNVTEGAELYVTPEMYGACGDGITDDSNALQKAFNDGRDVVFLNNYVITETIAIAGKSNLKVYGNNHTLTMTSKAPTDSDRTAKYAFYIKSCSNILFEDLVIQSSVDQNLIGIGLDESGLPKIYTDHFKSSNVQGFKIQQTSNLSIQNYISYNLHGDISLQGCNNIRIDHWYSNNSLMGIYTSATKDVSISNFKIISDPVNTIEHFHAFYFCYGTENVHIFNGEAIFENAYENVENVNYLNGDGPITVTQRTPLFTIHTSEEELQKQIHVGNVRFTAQRIINVRPMIDVPVFANCTFTTHYPENPLAAVSIGATANGQLTIFWNTTFNHCTFNLGNLDMGFETGGTEPYAILLNDCALYCNNKKTGIINDPLLLGYCGDFRLTNCSIEWPSFIRRLKYDNIVTEFYNCTISLPSNRAVIRHDQRVTTKTKTSIINCFVNGGYYVWYYYIAQEGKFDIIGSNLVSNNETWYQGMLTEFLEFAKIYNSYHNDTKISTTSSDALTMHTIDPQAHANLELDGNDSN